MKVYRIIEYDGPEDWIDAVIGVSIHGCREVGPGMRISGATIDPEDGISVRIAQDKLRGAIAQLTDDADEDEMGFGPGWDAYGAVE